jgi:hypothetical protein
METQEANASPAVAEGEWSVPAGDAAAGDSVAGTAVSCGGWWPAWRARFGLAEECCTVAAAVGFAEADADFRAGAAGSLRG